MKTITAKELRTDLDSILERVNMGEEIIVKHRFRDPVRITPLRPTVAEEEPSKTPGLDALLKAPRKGYYFDPNKSIKELYAESIAKKYL